MATTKEELPYGTWPSPITPDFITSSGVGLSGTTCPDPGSGDLFWLEARPEEGGRYVVVKRDPTSPDASERGAVDVIPKDHNARSRVHEYGGAAFVVDKDGSVIYSNFADQRLYRVKSPGADVENLTPKSAYEEDRRFRFADGVIDTMRNRLICVREDYTSPKPVDVKNAIVAVTLDGTGTMRVLVEGSDFYAAPRLSPDGESLAYVSWEHPNMPWDHTSLSVTRLDEAGLPTGESVCIAGGALSAGAGEADSQPVAVSVLQPAWSPTTGELHFVSDVTGWWNIYKIPAAAGPDLTSWRDAALNLLPRDVEFSGRAPGWMFGNQG